jgi:2-polyprenyl-3-methyl-5-hydroxy-6-metoxy-1,4-benzoquinol methylase
MTTLQDELLGHVYAIIPTQRKKVEAFHNADPSAKADLGRFLEVYRPYMAMVGLTLKDLAEGYCGMVHEMLGSRLAFLRAGSYPAKSQAVALEQVYSDPKTMRGYMIGSALSQFLWKAHYEMFKLYRETISGLARSSRLLEVGSGHGLFLYEALRLASDPLSVEVVDISDTSLAMSKGIIGSALPDKADLVKFQKADFTKFQPPEKYDFITMGEVLEHVDDALGMLRSVTRLLKPGGQAYISTCANCPAIDHVYEFHDTCEICELIQRAGLTIVRNIEIPSEDRPPEVLKKLRLDISYAAIVTPGA